jgi:hypothetical protein
MRAEEVRPQLGARSVDYGLDAVVIVLLQFERAPPAIERCAIALPGSETIWRTWRKA